MNSLLLVGIGFGVTMMGQGSDSKAYAAELAKWQRQQTAELTKPEGFLSVAGLFWLKEGDSAVGSDPTCVVRLSPSSSPAKIGTLKRAGNNVTLVVDDGVTVSVSFPDGHDRQEVRGTAAAAPINLKSDYTRVTAGESTFVVIKRGARVGVRLFDRGCPGYKQFKGQKWFPANLNYVFQAKFVPYDPPKMTDITNVLGDTSSVPIVGFVEFAVGGKTCRLDAEGQGDGLFINFRDLTSGKTTYPAGRFLDAPKPVNGKVIIDFNRATNPPCAFTAFATCPLPPISNYLEIPIPVGEKTHHPVGE